MFGVGIDIGTTTLQADLVDLDTGKPVDAVSVLNSQRKFGADVISRISAVREGKADELYSAINIQVEGILRHFIDKWDIDKIERCVVSGNTTMLHLFAGVDPSGMGVAPYTPVFLEERFFKGSDLSLSAEKITLLPGICAFVGADIVAGLAFIDIMRNGENADNANALFIDIGTNGEIALWKESEKQLLCCSTAAGPCFEEAKISCGITATAFINAIADMRRKNIIDETGALAFEYLQKGYSVAKGRRLKQKDIRQFQLAKSAIYSGIKTICRHAKTEPKNLNAVYIAGGLGYHLNLENAAFTGLLPKEFASNSAAVKTQVCGNTSLKGAVKSLQDPAFLPLCREIIVRAKTVDLASDKYFTAAFQHNLIFNHEPHEPTRTLA